MYSLVAHLYIGSKQDDGWDKCLIVSAINPDPGTHESTLT